MIGGWGRGGREVSTENTETQVHIPLKHVKWLMIAGDLFILGVNLISWCIWLHTWLQDGNRFWAWWPQWWTKISVKFPLILAWMIGWAIGLPIVLLIIRFVVDIWDRFWPPIEAKERAEFGPMGPFWAFRQRARVTKLQERYSELKDRERWNGGQSQQSRRGDR